ncbi:MAG TPA: hypothetical protein VFS10_02625 [Pyrinomonadaceae bacterium]|nr:hypothetical protein [Pyrinomonadaceae bacterium]
MRRFLASVTLVALCNITLLPVAALGQANNSLPEQAVEHRAEVSRPVHFDTTTRPLREMFPTKDAPPARAGRDFRSGSPQAHGDTNPSGNDPLVEKSGGTLSAFAQPRAATIGTEVDPNARVAPPDTTGDVGPNHYVQWVNLRYSIYTLTRDANGISGFNLVAGFPKQGNVVWQGFGGPCQNFNDGDPIVQYDQLADRWVLTQFAVSSTPYTQCVAVSTGPDPTGTYHRYSFSYNKDFNDYPKMGVWPNGYYITYNMFRNGRSYVGNRVCAFERDRMLLGQSARQVCAQTGTSQFSLVPADLEGSTLPPANAPNYLLSITSTALNFWRFAVNWTTGTGTLTGPITVPGVAAFSRACGGGTCIPQPGTTRTLDSLGDRLMYRLAYRNLGTREALVINHSVATGGSSGVRWYELSNAVGQTLASANPVVRQQGTFAPDASWRWMGSAAIDKTGGIAVGYNISNSTTIKPSIRYAYRGPLDPLGAMGNETDILAGPGVQTGTLARWGDYSTLSVDPVDGCTMVFTTQYQPANGSFNWTTYISSFKLSTCL